MPRGPRIRRWLAPVVALGLALVPLLSAADDETTRALATIKAIPKEGKGNDSAGLAWKAVVSKGAVALFPTLEAIDDGNPTASNWLRTAVDAIAEGEKATGRKLPADKLEAFAKDTKFAPSARRIAFELLVAQDPTAKERLLAGFINDVSPELRRDAVAAELDKIEKAAKPTAKDDLLKLFAASRDKDQIELIAGKLEETYKTPVNVTEHFGFVTHWHLAGPFDSAEGKALTTTHPPEKAADLKATLKGKDGADVAWKSFVTGNKYGTVDLTKAVGKIKNAATYAVATVQAEKATPCEIRVGSPNAVVIFLNGTKLFEREEYHHGGPLDANIGKGVLKPGKNEILVKVCQNDQKEEWAQLWQFQLRVCDATGGTLPNVTQLVPADGQPKSIKIGHIPEALREPEKKEEKK